MSRFLNALAVVGIFAAFPGAFLLGMRVSGGMPSWLVVSAFVIPAVAPLVALFALYLVGAAVQLLGSIQRLAVRR